MEKYYGKKKLKVKQAWNPYPEVKVDNSGEDPLHCVITKCGNWYYIEVSQETRSDRVSTTTRRTHCTHKLKVNQSQFRCVLPVIPIPMVQILTKKFYWRLGTILFQSRHIYIINKNNESVKAMKIEFSEY